MKQWRYRYDKERPCWQRDDGLEMETNHLEAFQRYTWRKPAPGYIEALFDATDEMSPDDAHRVIMDQYESLPNWTHHPANGTSMFDLV